MPAPPATLLLIERELLGGASGFLPPPADSVPAELVHDPLASVPQLPVQPHGLLTQFAGLVQQVVQHLRDAVPVVAPARNAAGPSARCVWRRCVWLIVPALFEPVRADDVFEIVPAHAGEVLAVGRLDMLQDLADQVVKRRSGKGPACRLCAPALRAVEPEASGHCCGGQAVHSLVVP